MSLLQSLEKKIVSLIELVKTLKHENNRLQKDISGLEEDNKKFKKQVEMLESSMLKENNRLHEQLQKEKELTKTVVDDLIKNIDAIVGSENQPS
jgi:predicted  nucleic acid-binding Zn-ribbon protein